MQTLTDKEQFPRKRLIDFMNSMKTEKRFFSLTINEVLAAEILIYLEKDNRIIGIGGLRFHPGVMMKYLKLPLEFIAVLEQFQGQSIGRRIRTEMDKAGTERYNCFVATIAKDNVKALNLYRNSRFRYLGATNDRIYLLRPSNVGGLITYYLLKISFSLVMPLRNIYAKQE